MSEVSAFFAVLGGGSGALVTPTNDLGNAVGLEIVPNDTTGETIISIKLEVQSEFSDEQGHINILTNESGELFGKLNWVKYF